MTLNGAFLVQPERLEDERGFFARTFCKEEFARQGLLSEYVQTSLSFNTRKGTLRGMHFQMAPNSETKVVQCLRGAAYDVIVDLNECSPTYLKWEAVELTEQNKLLVYIPQGFAHGFLTLADNTELQYMISNYYAPKSASGVLWDDPRIDISWPMAPLVISERDRSFAPIG